MSEPLDILIIAAGGYGGNYVNALLDNPDRGRIVAICDPFVEKADTWPRIQEAGIPCFSSSEDFYTSHTADLAIISSPIHLHCPHTCAALRGGSHVLCEKPVSGSLNDAREMLRVSRKTGRSVAIGYQLSYTEEVQSLKRDIQSGIFGRPLRLKTYGLAFRNHGYYGRSSWAGMLTMPDGAIVCDSPVNNAVAHYIHNMFYILGDAVDTSARLKTVQAELYRANDITSFDTGVIRMISEDGVEIFFVASHAIPANIGLLGHFEYENATITWRAGSGFTASMSDGSTREYPGTTGPDAQFNKLWKTIDCIQTGGEPICGLIAAGTQTICIDAIHRSVPDIHEFPAELIRVTGEGPAAITWAEGLQETLLSCFEEWKMPSELAADWAIPGEIIPVAPTLTL